MKRLLFVSFLAVTLLLAGCDTRRDGIVTGPRTLDHQGGMVFSEDMRAFVNVPAGAISPGEQIEISVVKSVATPPAHLGSSTGVVYEFRPSGTHFNSLVTIYTKYDVSALPDGITPSDLSVVLRSGETGEWAELSETVSNPQNNTVSGKTSHFSTAVQVVTQRTPAPAQAFQNPLPPGALTQAFAAYEDAFDSIGDTIFEHKHHTALDIAAGGATVRAAANGKVWKTGVHGDASSCEFENGASQDRLNCTAYGNGIIIKHAENLYSLYGHLADISVSVGDEVNAGAIIGIEGDTGAPGAIHLHFEVRTFDEWSWPGEKAEGERGNGYLISHPGTVDSTDYYIDPLTLMEPLYGHYQPITPRAVRVTTDGTGRPLRPNPTGASTLSTVYRATSAGEVFNAIAEARYSLPVGAQEGCLTWYQVQATTQADGLSRWVPDATAPNKALYIRIDVNKGKNAAVPTAWICAEYQENGTTRSWLEPIGSTTPSPTNGPEWAVSPSQLHFQGITGEGAPPPTYVTITNIGDEASAFTIDNQPSWVTVSGSTTSLAPGQSRDLIIGVTSCNYSSNAATLRIGTTHHRTDLEIGLECYPAGELNVTPTGRWSISGEEGGPFTSTSRTFTLQNPGSTAIAWQATENVAWLEFSGSTSGTLQPGASTTVTLMLDQSGSGNARTLSSGRHSANVEFRNNTSGGTPTSVNVRLDIDETTPVLPETPLVRNSTFNGPSNWTITGTAWIWNGGSEDGHNSYPGYAALGVNSGGWAANNVAGSIHQTVQVPAGATRARFSYEYNLTSTDNTRNADPTLDDFFLVMVSALPCGSVGVGLPGRNYNPTHRQATAGDYRLVTDEFNITPYAGKTLCVYIGGSNDAADPSVFRIDDVQLTVWSD